MLHDSVLVKPIVLEKSGKVVKPQGYDDKPEYGEVVGIGEGKMLETGVRLPVSAKEGDIILFQKYSASKIRHDGVDYLIVRDEDIYWVNK